jgi:hypothetical protein
VSASLLLFDKRNVKGYDSSMETRMKIDVPVGSFETEYQKPHVVSEPTGLWTPENALRLGANGRFPLRLGAIKADILGGPYRKKPSHYYGIKMAEEINADCVISIPTRDFSVPDSGRLLAGLYSGITLAQQGAPLWVGCMGGIGRTGLYFAALAKVMAGYQRLMKHRPIDPISYVRATYHNHAVETQQQMQWVADLDVSAVVQWVAHLQGYRAPWYRRLFS